jgi:hypothetical protein
MGYVIAFMAGALFGVFIMVIMSIANDGKD